MKSSEIQELIKFVAKSGVSEVKIEDKDFKIVIKTTPHKKGRCIEETQQFVQAPVSAPVQVANIAPVAAQITPVTPTLTTNAEDNSRYISIKSPMIGTFYRKPSPDKSAFVNVGDDVIEDTVVCMIEAMKLFNEIEAEVKGKIIKTLVDDGSPVEYDQPLYLVDPS